MTPQRILRLKRKLQSSRFRLLHMEYSIAEPLKRMTFSATKSVWHISTNGQCIMFDPDWLQKLEPTALDFILSHQLMHIALGHINRPKYYTGDRYHLAADIVANSHLGQFGWQYGRLPMIGNIYYQTFFPCADGRTMTSEQAMACVPFDPSAMKPSEQRRYMIDSEEWWDKKEERGESGIIVLSPEDKDPEDLIYDGPTFDGGICYKQEVFIRQPEVKPFAPGEKSPGQNHGRQYGGGNWESGSQQIIRSLRNQRDREDAMDDVDIFTERQWLRSRRSSLDWKKLLNAFVQENVFDYSFSPPDRRFGETDLLLPDYNVMREVPKNVLFLVDTSASVTDEMLAAACGEIEAAIACFSGSLTGTLAFFDTKVYPPAPFGGTDALHAVVPVGGGGTDYNCIFRFVSEKLRDTPPSSIVIITDGNADFPDEKAAGRIPVLWLFTTDRPRPPWGQYAKIKL